MLEHSFGVGIRDQEGDIVSLLSAHVSHRSRQMELRTYLYGFPAQNNKALCSLHHESGEFMAQNTFYLVGLLDLDAQANGVHGGFNQDTFILVSGYCERIEENFLGSTGVVQ